MIGRYEAPLFAKNGWLDNLSTQCIASDPGYDASGILPSISKALSDDGSLYAVPFYGESSVLYYRTDLFKAAGLTMPAHPTWAQVAAFAAKLNQPGRGRRRHHDLDSPAGARTVLTVRLPVTAEDHLSERTVVHAPPGASPAEDCVLAEGWRGWHRRVSVRWRWRRLRCP
jgi:Bacterial extracellular solute-binding protein